MKRAHCSYCGKKKALTKRGTIKAHYTGIDPFTSAGITCPGSGKAPK